MVGSPVRSPLSRSLGGFFGAMAASLAAIIDIVALTAPWAVLVAGVLWLLRRRLPKRAATEAPARLLGRGDVGRLAPGVRADVVVLEDDLTVRDTYVGGQPADRSAP